MNYILNRNAIPPCLYIFDHYGQTGKYKYKIQYYGMVTFSVKPFYEIKN